MATTVVLQDYEIEAIKKEADIRARLAAKKAGQEVLDDEAILDDAAGNYTTHEARREYGHQPFSESYKEAYRDVYQSVYREFIESFNLGEEQVETLIEQTDDVI